MEVVGFLKDGGYWCFGYGYWFLLVFLLDVGYGVKVVGRGQVCNVLLLEEEKG